MAENIQLRESGPRCAVCRDIWHRDVIAEVDYRYAGTKKNLSAGVQPGVSVCVDCILSERWLHRSTKGQVKAFNMLRQCAMPGCGGNQSNPMWFCYDCFKFVCNECKQGTEHSCDGKQVGNKKKQIFKYMLG